MEGHANGSRSGHQTLETKLTQMLQIVVLPEMSGVQEQCIYTVPQDIRQVNPKAYTPQVVSIGPFHKPRDSGGEDNFSERMEDNFLERMEELKLKYLKGFLNRTPHLCVGDFVHRLEELETRIRTCYARPINCDSNHFLKMVLIDACFIIEHFLRCCEFNDWRRKQDPILLKPWLLKNIRRDLILLENQLPFFVLEDIYNLTGMNIEFTSFLNITLFYFSKDIKQRINSENIHPKHFTDLLRTFMIPSSFDDERTAEMDAINHVYSASQLKDAGLRFRVSEENRCLLDIEFDKGKGVLKMPCIEVHDSTEIYMRNIMAFEQCHLPDSPYVAQYFTFLDFLINKENDVNILIVKKIIVNLMGDPVEVATMVNNLRRNVITPYFNSRYLCLCNDLNRFYENPRNKHKAIFKHQYFNTPWKIASTIAAVLLLLLTLIQTISSVISLFQNKK